MLGWPSTGRNKLEKSVIDASGVPLVPTFFSDDVEEPARNQRRMEMCSGRLLKTCKIQKDKYCIVGWDNMSS